MYPLSLLLRALLLLAILLASTVARAAGARATVPVTPAPHWVSRVALEPPNPSDTGRGGVVEELLDEQVRVGKTVERYRRHVRRFTTTAGIEAGGEIQIDFDPFYERLRLHAISIVRGEERIDALKSASIRVIEQEASSDERVYNGELTALIVVNDLRIGDSTDLEYTLEGQNPVFGGRFVDNEPLSSSRGARKLRVRALLPAGRPIAFHAVGIELAPLESAPSAGASAQRELVWERRDVGPAPEDDHVPSWFDLDPFVSFSELGTWADVARWAVPLFEGAMKPAPAIARKAKELEAAAATPEARALAALRFVQDDVRYLGVEMGASSHRPHDAARVLAQRFGDCKDKVVLFVALLRALGIDGRAVLVESDLGAHVASRPPSPFAFDHVIARVHVSGRDIWVDPTRSLERGPLGGTPVTFGRGLVVDPTSTDLAAIEAPPPAAPLISAQESYVLDASAGSLEVITTYRGEEADDLRQHAANTPREKLARDWLDYYAEMYKGIEPVGEPALSDDPATDVIVVREHYALKDPLSEGGLDIAAGTITPFLRKPRVTHRTTPLEVSFPAYYRHEVVVKGVRLEAEEDKAFHDDALEFTRRTETGDDTTSVVFELRTKSDAVPAESVAAHLALLDSIEGASTPTLGVEEPSDEEDGSEGREMAWGFGILAAFVVAVVVRVLAVRARRRRWAKKVTPQSGETAALAQVVPTRTAAAQVLLTSRCTCGGVFGIEGAGAWTALAYGGREVTAGRATCASCGERRVRYFAGVLEE